MPSAIANATASTFLLTEAQVGKAISVTASYYTATLDSGAALSSWLTFNASIRSFGGTPSTNDMGKINIKVTVTDCGSLSATDVFALTVFSNLSGKTYF